MSKIVTIFRRCLGRLSAERNGVAAVEFGLIVPVLTIIVITIADVANIAVGVGDMQTALRASIQYAMNGGTNMTTAQSQGTQAWHNEPNGATFTATQTCYCSGAAHSCATLCTGGTSPQMYIGVTASAKLGGNVISQTETFTETVRVK